MSLGGSKSSGSSTTTQKVEPWDGQKDYLAGMFQRASEGTGGAVWDDETKRVLPFSGENGMYGTIFSPDYYSGQTVADQDPYTQQAIQMQAQRAMNGSPYNANAGNQINSTLAGNYLNSPVNQYAQNLMGQSGKIPDFLQAYNGGTAGQWNDPGASQAAISQWQGGQNGYLDSMVGRAQNQTLANTAGSFSKAGRYGSGSHEAAAHDAAGNIANQMYGQAYEGDQNRDLSAHQSYTNAQVQNAALANQASDRSLNAWNSQANRDLSAWQQDQSNRLNAYQNNQNLGYNAASLLQGAYDRERGNMMTAMQYAPTLAQQSYQDIAALSEAGAAREGYNQSLINADIDRYNYNAAVPLKAMQNYGSMISGNYGMSGTSTAKGGRGGSNQLGGIMSGALGGAALGNMTGMGSGWGAAGGGFLGLLGGLF